LLRFVFGLGTNKVDKPGNTIKVLRDFGLGIKEGVIEIRTAVFSFPAWE
jgi:hypothetical protein